MMEYSVVIPAWNAASTLLQTIASARAQTVPPRRIVVVDDGSTDATAEVAAGAGAVLIRQANAGPGSACMAGIAATDTPLVALLDADDLWFPDKMERQIAVLLARPEVEIVSGAVRTFASDDPLHRPMVQSGMLRPTLVIRRGVFDRIGPIEDMPGLRGDMLDWLARFRHAGLCAEELPDVVALRRVHRGSLSFGRDALRDRGYIEVARRALMRRRAMAEGGGGT
ncbi:glycosyltransferase family 2 protein [Gemmobacter aquarius]|uniref:Glycosyltransferase family 2 protein n=2 Tax=Paragemmobacter aquarius TaxID=2169400 RepID=A0A2S0UMY6_9RHOB|nr:glycosyltransferase family 2 protein [Gemmobacter aquarius]